MPYLKIFVTSENFAKMKKISAVSATAVATLLRPYVNRGVTEITGNYFDCSQADSHQKIILRAMRFQNTTIEEFIDWTGLEREIVQTTLSELIELNKVRRQHGHRKIVNYFLIEK